MPPAKAAVARPTAVAGPPRMTLGSITDTKRRSPDRILLVGVEGVGKSTFSASAPSPIFIAAESGLAEITTSAFPEPKTLGDLYEAIDVLTNEEHNFQTLAIDTWDWLEPLIWQQIMEKDRVSSIEEVGGGYGKGYTAAAAEARLILGRLDQLQTKRGMEVHILAHAAVVPFKNPAGPDFDRYEPKIHKKGGGQILKEWAKTILFATFEEWTVDAQRGEELKGVASKKKAKGVASGNRIIHTQRTAAWDAKNRYNLPPTLALDYASYAAAREDFYTAEAPSLWAECQELLGKLGLDADSKQAAYIEKNKDDAEALGRALNGLRAELA